MTEKQAEVIRALADNNLCIADTARSMGKTVCTVRETIRRIQDNTGLYPLNFYDLNELLKEVDRKTFKCTCKICGAKFEAPDHHYRICSDRCRAIAKERSDANTRAKSWDYRQTQKENKKMRTRFSEAQRERDLEEVGAYKRPAPAMSLAEASRLARERGMTYGQYMTWLRECGR